MGVVRPNSRTWLLSSACFATFCCKTPNKTLFKEAKSKRYFPVASRACPTNGSACGSLRSHNLTLFVKQKK
jgi:hypothetical protein